MSAGVGNNLRGDQQVTPLSRNNVRIDGLSSRAPRDLKPSLSFARGPPQQHSKRKLMTVWERAGGVMKRRAIVLATVLVGTTMVPLADGPMYDMSGGSPYQLHDAFTATVWNAAPNSIVNRMRRHDAYGPPECSGASSSGIGWTDGTGYFSTTWYMGGDEGYYCEWVEVAGQASNTFEYQVVAP